MIVKSLGYSHDGERMTWISVEDEPIPDGDWLVYLPYKHVGLHIHVASYDGTYKVIGGYFAWNLEAPPTHWMSLPDSPAEHSHILAEQQAWPPT